MSTGVLLEDLSAEALAKEDLVAQLVEQYTFNVWALGSSPSGITEKTWTNSSGLFILAAGTRSLSRL